MSLYVGPDSALMYKYVRTGLKGLTHSWMVGIYPM